MVVMVVMVSGAMHELNQAASPQRAGCIGHDILTRAVQRALEPIRLRTKTTSFTFGTKYRFNKRSTGLRRTTSAQGQGFRVGQAGARQLTALRRSGPSTNRPALADHDPQRSV